MVIFIHHKDYVWYHNHTQKRSVCLANLNVKKKISEKTVKYYDIFKKSWVKRGLNLIMHVMVMKYGEKAGKI